jgi:asparaginyl-tRNA synthetase
VAPSFRAEKSLTRRLLPIEAELDFITFEDLLEHIETVICRVLGLTLADPIIAAYVKELNPDFQAPARPFRRMKYADAIARLVEHDIPTEGGSPHRFGQDMAKAGYPQCTYLPHSLPRRDQSILHAER